MSDEFATIDPRNNPESLQNEGAGDGENTHTSEPSTGGGGAMMSDAPTSEEGAHGVIDGEITGQRSSSMLSGVTISDEDAEEAVSGDTGPEHPGARR